MSNYGPLRQGLLRQQSYSQRASSQENGPGQVPISTWEQPPLQPAAVAAKPNIQATGYNARLPLGSATGQQPSAALAPAGHMARGMHGNSSSGVSWTSLCSEGRANADRKRGTQVVINDDPELKRWLLEDLKSKTAKKHEGQTPSTPPKQKPPAQSEQS